ncbi:MAG: competence/damage-inducible protein A [Anaerostipes sp.]|uniref:competence/damage-inducible protein A n=1 Tax=Anaerostipes sp. 992a TaxID=1261637 RepID=UPI0009535958|nr:competence/damage-inducible protein A [Anaerostipes sp. 992a]MCI5951459.1 competence/damage-inducible protein A [Anaerostipes sp.]MDD5968744.1 competence/damage-inducible protein A [Anaerostipes sp.]OLR62375.1 competence/damage-inducible protein A [Anaerostipes sp. 992a]
MVVELISVGTEILLGNIVNTNAAYLAERLAGLGMSVYYQTTVGDNPERLRETLQMAKKRSDVVILSGGLGPTQDDLTKETAAKVCGKKLYEDPTAKQMLISYFQRLGRKPEEISENNWKQAIVPEDSIVLYNDNGTAPGLIIQAEDQKKMILLPGPPNELIPMFEKDVAPYLCGIEQGVIYSKVVKIDTIGESSVETQILDLINSQSNPTVAPYAKPGEVHLRVTAKAKDEKEARELVMPVVEELKRRFGRHVFTIEEHITMEEALVELMKKHNLTFATAESCTGGLLAGRMVNVAGVSDCFKEGFITYANEAKMRYLGVSEQTLKEHGAVSEECAREMAEGLAKTTEAQVAVVTTGLAGPGGGTDTKKPGLVYIGCTVNGHTSVQKFQLKGNRSRVRNSAVVKAMTLMRHAILHEYEETI